MSSNINYSKNNYDNLFKDLENPLLCNLKNVQKYIPIYKQFFLLNETNYNNITLDISECLISIKEKKSENIYKGFVKKNKKEKNTETFFKFSPLIDPIKYITGKYDFNDTKITSLPTLNSNNEECLSKFLDVNNAAYIDSFFSYLSAKLHNKGFVHGIQYYGSFLGIKNNFITNIGDDFEIVSESQSFNQYLGVYFNLQDFDGEFKKNETCKYKSKLNIKSINNKNLTIKTFDDCDFDNIFKINNDKNDKNVKNDKNDKIKSNSIEEIYNNDNHNNSNDNNDNDSIYSNCSSRSSNSKLSDEELSDAENNENISDTEDDAEDDTEDNDTEDNDEDFEDCSDNSEETDIPIFVSINEFPVQVICLEKCKNTLDNYIVENEIENNEWSSIFFQIIITLVVYQKVYNFTHNDLHTNNIMYIETDEKFLYYKLDNKLYKVPTYGKIYKIIDFGRSIYDFNEKNICSDSFAIGEDASTQYNFGVYFNNKKPRLEPNMSFDLCRLGCSLFDFFFDEIDEVNNIIKKNNIAKLINDWCTDDKGRNILYKSNGDERYPEFKLYKMIARSVHNHTPIKQLENELFSKFIITNIENTDKIIDINTLI